MCGKARVGGQHHVHQSRCRGKKDVLEETWGQGSTAVTDRSRVAGMPRVRAKCLVELERKGRDVHKAQWPGYTLRFKIFCGLYTNWPAHI